ncbi:MAG: SEL1-like repeat protein [Nitrospira sp.]|nr:SEL1-like repeat protein [Nitrospira sp.]
MVLLREQAFQGWVLATISRGMEIEGMFQLSDQQNDGEKTPPSISSVVSKAYPGLVLVPPSDRTILRRRIVRGALVLIAVIWTVWTFTAQPPASDTPCHSETGQSGTENSQPACDTPPSTAEVETHSSEFNLAQASSVATPVEASPLPTISQPDREQPQPPSMVEHPSPPHTEPIEPRTEPQVRHSDQEKSAVARLQEKPVVNQESDAYLASQGDPFAQYRLGRRFAQQEGRQAPEAVSWYKKAFPGLHRLAEAGNGQAMYVLGVMYAYGRGVERDISQARRWLARAVDQKITAAQPVLANLPLPARPTSNLQIHAAESAKQRKQQN